MARKATKQAIADTFADMVVASSLSQVRIAALIDELGVNRNTFYYHFSSKYDVAYWIFRQDLSVALHRALPERELVCAPIPGDNDQPLAYFTHVEIGARTLDSSKFLRSLVECVLEKPEFYRRLFSVREMEFISLAIGLWKPAFEDDIDFILGGRYMPAATKGLLATTATRQATMTVEYFLDHMGEANVLLDEAANPFWNFIHEALSTNIERHPINRNDVAEARLH